MKILMALTYYYPHWTGLTAFAQRMAEGLVRLGHQVTVVSSWYDRKLPREDEHNGVRTVRVPTLLRLSRGQIMPSFPWVVNRLVREHDVVQVHTPMLETWLVGVLAHRAGRKLLMTHHGDVVMPSGLGNQLVQRAMNLLMHRGAEVADAISIYTRDYAENSDFLRPFLDKTVYIFPPVAFPPADDAAALRWRHELSLDGHKLVGFAGRFVEEKGFDYLLKAVPLLSAQMPDVRLVFAGESNVAYERFYQRCLPLIEAQRDRLVMLGLLTNPQQVANFYAMCDVFVLPSRTDCLASVQVEAMLSGTPVVATNIPGARQAVIRSGMGLLVEPEDEQALAEGLQRVLESPAAYYKPYEEIHSIFEPERSLAQYERLFESLIAGEPRPSLGEEDARERHS
jgi:glycosyltransferase involved in cell wall biosynthesis